MDANEPVAYFRWICIRCTGIIFWAHATTRSRRSDHDRLLASRPMALFALRVALGVMFIAHAYLKLAVFTVPGFAGFLGSVGLPAVLAWPIILAELARRRRHPGRLPRPPGLAGAAADPARRPGHPCPERLGVQRPQWRLGISGLPGAGRAGPGADRRRRLRRCARPTCARSPASSRWPRRRRRAA